VIGRALGLAEADGVACMEFGRDEDSSVKRAAGDGAVACRVPLLVPSGTAGERAVVAIVGVAHDRPRRARHAARVLLRGCAVLSVGEVCGCVGLDGVEAP